MGTPLRGLLDTSILVDVLRKRPVPLAWLERQSHLALPVPVYIEVLEGARNRGEQREAERLLGRFERIYLTLDDQDWALERLSLYHLSHGVGGLDCLIAAPAARLGLPLYTLNLRHFAPLLGAGAHQPY